MPALAPDVLILPLLQGLTPDIMPPFVYIALITAAGIITLYYLLGKFLDSPQINAFAREEFSQLVFSIGIVAIWFFAYQVMVAIYSAAVCGGGECNMFQVAYYSLSIVQWKLISAYLSYLSIETVVSVFSTIGFNLPLGFPILGVKWLSLSPLGGLGLLSNVIVTITESLGMLLGLAMGRAQLLSLFEDMVPAVLLPMGLLLRSLPFTRTTGSSLIAFSFAAFFIFPASIALSHYLMFSVYTPTFIPPMPTYDGFCYDPNSPADKEAAAVDLQGNIQSATEFMSEEMDPGYDSAWFKLSELGGDSKQALGSTYDAAKDHMSDSFSLAGIVPALIKPTTFGYIFFNLVTDRLQDVAQLAVLTTVTFVLEIIMTVTGYRAIAGILGGEMEILGLTKVV
jgi:hypothetical protein